MIKGIYNCAKLFILFATVASCATFDTQYKSANERNSVYNINANRGAKLIHQIFLTGDAGNYSTERDVLVPKALKPRLEKADENSTMIFLGNNVSPNGLPKNNDSERKSVEDGLNVQLGIVENFEGRVIFLPGNQDWKSGLPGLKRQEKHIETVLDKKNVFLPEPGCGGPEIIKVSDDIMIIAIDSYWWTANWDKVPEINENCSIDNRKSFLNAIYDEVKSNQGKQIFIAMHHSIQTSGPRGGVYTFGRTLLPIPLLGGLLRRNIGAAQDNNNIKLAELFENLQMRTSKFKNVTYISGHEHALQYAEADGNKFIVSGSGSKKSAGNLGTNHKFFHPGVGYCALKFYDDGSSFAEFYSVNNSAESKLIYKKLLHSPYDDNIEFDDAIYKAHPKEISASIYKGEHKKGFNEKLTGGLYRKLYYEKRDYPVLYLDEIMGGLKVVKKGGGNQTNSLRLEDKDGVEYALRSLKKDIGRMAFGLFDNSFLESITQDAFTWTNPFAMNAIPTISDAVGVYYAKSKIYYLPQQPSLGIYNADFGDQLYFLEERPDGDKRNIDNLGNAEKFVSSFDLVEKVLKNYGHKIDQRQLVKSRLLDLMLGDNDRHLDQWRWAAYKQDDYTLYKPIPRDRDQAFISMKGPLFSLAKMAAPLFRTFQNYESDMQNDLWFHYNASGFDRFFINEIPWSLWEEEIQKMQSNLTDEIIEEAIQKMPADAYSYRGEELIRSMKGRRKNLRKMARSLYDLHSRIISVHGTSKKDHFLLELQEDGKIKITVTHDNEDKTSIKYQRLIYPSETTEVELYGLDNNDHFEVIGDGQTSIKVRLIGGEDKDKFTIRAKNSKKVLIYDDLQNNEIVEKNEAKDKMSNSYDKNYFDQDTRSTIPKSVFFPILYYSRDNKLVMGISPASFKVHGFGRYPYSQEHNIKLDYATGTDRIRLGYDGYYYKILGDWGVSLHASNSNPKSTYNYFGIGNESIEDFDQENEFNQVRIMQNSLGAGLFNDLSSAMRLSFGSYYQTNEIQQTDGRYISIPAVVLELGPSPYENKKFIRSNVSFTYKNARGFYPTEGIDFNAEIGHTINLSDDRSFSDFKTHLSIYQNLNNSKTVVWASKTMYQTVSSGYEFYQSASLGGSETIRGFRRERFRGSDSFSISNDIRLNFGQLKNNFVPLEVGSFGSFDIGRVWAKGERSSDWHSSFGGGLWFEFFGIAGFSISYHKAIENDSNQILAGFGFNF